MKEKGFQCHRGITTVHRCHPTKISKYEVYRKKKNEQGGGGAPSMDCSIDRSMDRRSITFTGSSVSSHSHSLFIYDTGMFIAHSIEPNVNESCTWQCDRHLVLTVSSNRRYDLTVNASPETVSLVMTCVLFRARAPLDDDMCLLLVGLE